MSHQSKKDMNHLLVTLEITALGMGLVFAAIILLWWMMTLLTTLLAEKEDSAGAVAGSVPALDQDPKVYAAAVAVAVALAEHEASHAHLLPAPPTAIVSAWQLGMRIRQLYQKGMPIRPPRKVG